MKRTFSAIGTIAAIGLLAVPTGLVLAPAAAAAAAHASVPSVQAVPGKPAMLIGSYDVTKLGYQVDEYFLSGTAGSYKLSGPAPADGRWNATAAATAPYKTRVVVIRPSNPAKFSGTVLVEWLNVTAGQDTPADWMVAHREMLRRGHAYVGVSAQQIGIEGGQAITGGAGAALKKTDPQRYGQLSHPGDAFSFDIYSQAGAALKARGASGLVGPLVPKHVLGIGESQSAAYLTSYVNAVDPIAQVYDGFFIHSRFGGGAGLEGRGMAPDPATPKFIRFRPDLRVPVLALITETDLVGARIPGYHASRRPDDAHLRVWEVAGTSHADNYLFGASFIDGGPGNAAALAKAFTPTTSAGGQTLPKPANPGMAHHYVVEAALDATVRWVATGQAPPSTLQLTLASGGTPDAEAKLALDANGLAQGGVRTPWVDVPTMRLSGAPASDSFLGMLVGSAEPFDAATLTRLYPGGKAEYLAKFTKALDQAIQSGHVLAEDRQEILDIAALNYPG